MTSPQPDADSPRTDTAPAIELLTQSELRTVQKCQRLHDLMYRQLWRPTSLPFPLARGGAWARFQEARGDGGDLPDAEIEGALENPYDQVILEELANGYIVYYHEDGLEYLETEVVAEIPLVNPDTMRPSRTFRLTMKKDSIVRTADGKVCLKEDKQTGSDISEASTYWDKLGMDPQISMYVMGAESLGHKIEEIIYDVTRWPSMKPYLATPVEKRKFRKPKKDEQHLAPDDLALLYKGQHLEDEPLNEWRWRLRHDICERPEFYFVRRTFVRTESQIADFLRDVWQVVAMMRMSRKSGYTPRNPNQCHVYGQCPFWDHCAFGVPLDHNPKFEQIAVKHPELLSDEEEGDDDAEG